MYIIVISLYSLNEFQYVSFPFWLTKEHFPRVVQYTFLEVESKDPDPDSFLSFDRNFRNCIAIIDSRSFTEFFAFRRYGPKY